MAGRFSNRGVATKISTAVGVGVVALVVVGGVAVNRLGSVRDTADAMYTQGLARKSALDDVTARMFEVRAYVNRIVIDSTPEEVAKREQQIADTDKALQEAFDTYGATYGTTMPAEVKTLFDKAEAANAARRKVYTDELLPLARKDDDDGAKVVIDGNLTKARTALVDSVGALDKLEDTKSAALRQQAKSTYSSALATLIAVIVLGAAAALALGLRIARGIAKPLGLAASELQKVADGDLTVTLDIASEDEVGTVATAINQAVGSMRIAVTDVAATADTLSRSSTGLASVATEMSAVSQQTSSQAVEVAASSNQVSGNLQTMSAAAEEMGASIQDIARNASHASGIAVEAAAKAERAGAVMETLGEASSRVGTVVRTITAIAEQTNLLALNATIEAARAGEAGRGFAVVANEVKELAQATAKATSEIEETVAAISSQSAGAITAMQEIRAVIQQVNDAQSMIAAAVEEQSATAAEIVRAVHEAAGGADAIAKAIDGVAEASTSSAASADHTLQVSADLSAQSDELSRLVGQFRV